MHRAAHARGEQFLDRIPIVSAVLQVVRGVACPHGPGAAKSTLRVTRAKPGRPLPSGMTRARGLTQWGVGISAAVVLAACGGGGEDDGEPVGTRSS